MPIVRLPPGTERRVIVSIFNDVIGPVMRGPSSSHCAAALRIGRLARDLMDGDIGDALVEFDRNGSLPTTHETQGSDMGLCGGLLGWDAADDRLPGSVEALRAAGVGLRFDVVDVHDPHPNTYRLTLRNARGRHSMVAVSTGGGMVEVVEIDGFKVSMAGDCFETLLWTDGPGDTVAADLAARMPDGEVLLHPADGASFVEVKAPAFVDDDIIGPLRATAGIRAVKRLAPVLPVLAHKGMKVPFTTCAEMLRHDAGRNTPLWELAAEYETARGGLAPGEAVGRMAEIVRTLHRSVAQGIAGTRYEDRMLGPQSGAFKARMDAGQLLPAGLLNRTVLHVSALMEVKSSMGVIVAAPTAGACAALPGAVMAAAEEMELSEEAMAKALLAGGLVGVFIASQWTFAAEVGGCQAECGAASCMAAAALATLAGGTLRQSTAAADRKSVV